MSLELQDERDLEIKRLQRNIEKYRSLVCSNYDAWLLDDKSFTDTLISLWELAGLNPEIEGNNGDT